MVGAVLRRAGHEVRVLDAPALGTGPREILQEAKGFQPQVIGLTAVTPAIGMAGRLSRMMKECFPDVPVVAGGPHVTALPEETLREYPSIDCLVRGEGEETLPDLVSHLCGGGRAALLNGVTGRQGEEILAGPPRPAVSDLDSLPFPAWDLLEGFPRLYRPALFKYRRLPATHIVSSRGCPNQCTFCDTSVFGRRVRFHSAEYVLAMIRHLVKRFGMREIIFEDDQFLLRHERVASLCEGLLGMRGSVSWSCSARVGSVPDVSLLKLMKRSGCWQISYGIESGNQRILDSARKGITVKEAERAVRLTHQAGILSKGFFILGLPGETERTLEETRRFVKKIPLGDISVFMLTPFPGSEIFEMLKRQGAAHWDFEKMNILSVVHVPEGLQEGTLLEAQRRLMREFYLRPGLLLRYLRRLAANPADLMNMVRALKGFLSYV
jgi:radical SAM superfamily enzyme YgiQ (UPF0313 family)